MYDVFARDRGTGRTTRMLKAALEHAKTHSRIVIMADSHFQIGLLAQALQDLDPGVKRKRYAESIYEPTATLFQFFTVTHPSWDWKLKRLRGFNDLIPVFVDHYAIENYLGWILVEWKRYQA